MTENDHSVAFSSSHSTNTRTFTSYVIDLHIISNSMAGLIAIIVSLIEDCSKQGIIINLNKSKILLSKEQEKQQAELLNNHAILKCFEQHNTSVEALPFQN